MDYNLLITSSIISAIFLSCVILKCKYVTKEKINLKSAVLDSLIVLLITFFGLNILPLLTQKSVPKAFTQKPSF